ncbi:hypothetical protein [Chromohalobacter sp. 48-RD10]|uniref:hypothetical protein n=1 Tax=Chromohalobacter sp. 48-RD10 TaxID=2994063 RepID=UPI002469A160|nr:hypothetical protein [Chromohalobacter sp. 48-RD10]
MLAAWALCVLLSLMLVALAPTHYRFTSVYQLTQAQRQAPGSGVSTGVPAKQVLGRTRAVFIPAARRENASDSDVATLDVQASLAPQGTRLRLESHAKLSQAAHIEAVHRAVLRQIGALDATWAKEAETRLTQRHARLRRQAIWLRENLDQHGSAKALMRVQGTLQRIALMRDTWMPGQRRMLAQQAPQAIPRDWHAAWSMGSRAGLWACLVVFCLPPWPRRSSLRHRLTQANTR